jgi:uncharacterized protein YdeI (YjbR/CyaY-like superfamily)
MDGKNVVIIQGCKEYCALGFFQGALLKDPKKLLVQLGQVQAARVMKFTTSKEMATKAATIKAYVREAVAAAKAATTRSYPSLSQSTLFLRPLTPTRSFPAACW